MKTTRQKQIGRPPHVLLKVGYGRSGTKLHTNVRRSHSNNCITYRSIYDLRRLGRQGGVKKIHGLSYNRRSAVLLGVRGLCDFCGLGRDKSELCGRLREQGTIVKDCIKFFTGHQRCMQYSSGLCQYHIGVEDFGGFYVEDVIEELKVGRRRRKLVCAVCKQKEVNGVKTATTSSCSMRLCYKTFHYPCAKTDSKAITRRMVNQKTGELLYRVFCSRAHYEWYTKKDVVGKHARECDDSDSEDDQINPNALQNLPTSQSNTDQEQAGNELDMSTAAAVVTENHRAIIDHTYANTTEVKSEVIEPDITPEPEQTDERHNSRSTTDGALQNIDPTQIHDTADTEKAENQEDTTSLTVSSSPVGTDPALSDAAESQRDGPGEECDVMEVASPTFNLDSGQVFVSTTSLHNDKNEIQVRDGQNIAEICDSENLPNIDIEARDVILREIRSEKFKSGPGTKICADVIKQDESQIKTEEDGNTSDVGSMVTGEIQRLNKVRTATEWQPGTNDPVQLPQLTTAGQTVDLTLEEVKEETCAVGTYVISCDIPGCTALAIKYCQQCRTAYCENDAATDHQGHLHVDVDGVVFCHTHKLEAAQHVCKTCDVIICTNCKDHRDHIDHDVMSVDDVKGRLRDVIQGEENTQYKIDKLDFVLLSKQQNLEAMKATAENILVSMETYMRHVTRLRDALEGRVRGEIRQIDTARSVLLRRKMYGRQAGELVHGGDRHLLQGGLSVVRGNETLRMPRVSRGALSTASITPQSWINYTEHGAVKALLKTQTNE